MAKQLPEKKRFFSLPAGPEVNIGKQDKIRFKSNGRQYQE